MARFKLTIAKLKSLPAGKHSDGDGLWIYKSLRSGSWVYRYTIDGRRRETGLGSYPDVSLAEAREKAEVSRQTRAQGRDPLTERMLEKKRHRKATLSEVAHEAFEAHKATLKGDGQAGRWFSPLRLHVLPKLGHHLITDIDQNDYRAALNALWLEKEPTAEKALDRLNICIRYAAAKGLGVNVAVIQHTKILLGRGQHKVQHIPAMDWRDVPAFYASLSDFDVTHLALRFLILSPGQRSKPLRYMRFDQIRDNIWIIPGEEMKGKRDRTPDFKVPLSRQAVEIVDFSRAMTKGPFVFPSRMASADVISDATLSKFMRTLGLDARPHGFRSSFSTWARETGQRGDIREMCLAHTVGTEVERAYMRSDLIDERREMMQRWGDWVVERRG
jgi:integrase